MNNIITSDKFQTRAKAFFLIKIRDLKSTLYIFFTSSSNYVIFIYWYMNSIFLFILQFTRDIFSAALWLEYLLQVLHHLGVSILPFLRLTLEGTANFSPARDRFPYTFASSLASISWNWWYSSPEDMNRIFTSVRRTVIDERSYTVYSESISRRQMT